MSEILPVVVKFGRWAAIKYAVKVLIWGEDALKRTIEGRLARSTMLSVCTSNLQIPPESIVVLKVGNDNYPCMGTDTLESIRQACQSYLNQVGIQATVWATHHAVDFAVLSPAPATKPA